MRSSTKSLRKILYVGMRHDYGRVEQGTSFEYNNFYRTLERMVRTVVEFDFMTLLSVHGKEAVNAMLLETAEREHPDLVFFILFTDEISKETIGTLSGRYMTLNWFCDDHWRFNNFSRYYAPFFSFVATTDPKAAAQYRKIGYKNALLTQWACNHYDYRKLPESECTLDVSFVGQPHGTRKAVMKYLRRQGVDVQAFGRGWPNGRVTQDQMIKIFNSSRINLNLSNSSWNPATFFRRQEQIKGRNFEVPGCGGFLLTNAVQGLEGYYDIGKEIACFANRRDLVELIRYYLAHEEERQEIARRGYERTLREHTYEKRFNELFESMGFEL